MRVVRKIHAVAFQIHKQSYCCSSTRWAPTQLHSLVRTRVLHSREIVTIKLDLCLARTFHMNYKNCKNEQLELHFIWKFEFSAAPPFFPGRQRCQNVLFIQSFKRKKMPNKLKIWSQLNLNGAPITPIFFKLLQKCLSLIRLSYFKACPVVICLWYRVALWSWMFIFIETLLSVSE